MPDLTAVLPGAYYAADLLLAVSFPILAWALDRSDRPTWRMFWLGTALGLLWEIPIFAFSAWTHTPVIGWLAPLPLPPSVFIVAHSLWDGALLSAGWMLSDALTQKPGSTTGLGVQIAWGQVTELCVELSAITAGTWVYLDGLWFNPPLFHVRGHPIPLALQVIWLAASVVFFVLVRRIPQRN